MNVFKKVKLLLQLEKLWGEIKEDWKLNPKTTVTGILGGFGIVLASYFTQHGVTLTAIIAAGLAGIVGWLQTDGKITDWKSTLAGAAGAVWIGVHGYATSHGLDAGSFSMMLVSTLMGVMGKGLHLPGVVSPKGGYIDMRKFGKAFGLLMLAGAILLMGVIAARAADISNAVSAPATTTNIASAISNYVQNNANAESTLGIVLGGGTPQLGIGTFVGIYNGSIGSKSGAYKLGVKYTGVVTSASQENLLGLGGEAKVLRFLPGDVPPPLGIVDPALYGSVNNDLSEIFKRWRFEAGLSIINVKFKSVLGL